MAEVLGADLALCLYEKYQMLCQSVNQPCLPLGHIQGDIKPLLNHLRFESRFREATWFPLLIEFIGNGAELHWDLPTEYRPREATFVADYLAGQEQLLPCTRACYFTWTEVLDFLASVPSLLAPSPAAEKALEATVAAGFSECMKP